MERLKDLDITQKELKEVYERIKNQVIEEWRSGCLQHNTKGNLFAPSLVALLGVSKESKLLGKVEWVYANETGVPSDWQGASIINILENEPFALFIEEYYYDDPYFMRTGEVEQKYYIERVKDFPLEIKKFEDALEELLEEINENSTL